MHEISKYIYSFQTFFDINDNLGHATSSVYIMGTGGGYAYVFQEDSPSELKLTHKFLAHAPQPDNTHPRFPSISMFIVDL